MLRSDATAVPQISTDALRTINARTSEISQKLLQALREGQPGVFRKQWWDEKVMSWAMHDEDLKVQLFRFVDVLPMLHSDDSIAQHLTEYLGQANLPTALRSGCIKTETWSASAVMAER